MRRLGLVLLVLAACGDAEPTPLPADVDAVLADACRQCHGAEPAFGAPMPLVTWEDTQAPARTQPSLAVWELMQQRVNDSSRPMPPRGNGELSDAQHAILDQWFAAGAPPADE